MIGSVFSVDGLIFDGVDFERPDDSGGADIVVLSRGKLFIVIKTKRKQARRTSQDTDLLSPDVIG